MTGKNIPLAVIILLDGDTPNQNTFIRSWFRRSGFPVFETNCVIQALSAAFDFTKLSRPEVILLEVDSITDDFRLASTLSAILSADESVPVLAFTARWRPEFGDNFESDLTRLEARLTNILSSKKTGRQPIAA